MGGEGLRLHLYRDATEASHLREWRLPVLGGLGGFLGGVCELRELSVPSSPGFSGCQGFGDLTL